MAWNLLDQLYVQEFHRGLELLRLHAWKLSSNSFKSQVFLRLQMLSLQISGDPRHVSTKESCPDSHWFPGRNIALGKAAFQ